MDKLQEMVEMGKFSRSVKSPLSVAWGFMQV